MNTVGQKIKSIRKKMGLTQQEFSESICISQAHLSMIERDKENPSKAVIRLISILFNVDEAWILAQH